jgi:hypothetical protein
MRRCARLLAGLALWAVCAESAAAQGGAGLYEPFPEPTDPKASRDFIEALPPPGPELARILGATELERGVRVPAAQLPDRIVLVREGSGEVTARAAADGSSGSAPGWIGAGALVGLLGAAAVRLAPR